MAKGCVIWQPDGNAREPNICRACAVLNMIDLVFYGSTSFGIRWRSRKEQAILDSWKEYLDHLNTKHENQLINDWGIKGDELFVNLLYSISRDLGFVFDRVQLKKGIYSPVAHGNLEMEQAAHRRLVIELLAGDRPLIVQLKPIVKDTPE